MDNERDIVEFIAENGDKIEFEVVDYFLYDGDEYVILADLGCDCCDEDSKEKVDVFIMKVEIVDDENEQFVMVPPEIEDKVLDFAGKLLRGELPNEDEIL